jgi:hypothetical protein
MDLDQIGAGGLAVCQLTLEPIELLVGGHDAFFQVSDLGGAVPP